MMKIAYLEFSDILFYREVKIGPPSEKNVFLGPLNSKPHLEKVMKYITYAVEDGGEVLCGHGVDILDLPPQNKEVRCTTVDIHPLIIMQRITNMINLYYK